MSCKLVLEMSSRHLSQHIDIVSLSPSDSKCCPMSGVKYNSVQIMAWRLFELRPLPAVTLTCCQLDHWAKNSMKFISKYQTFYQWKLNSFENVFCEMVHILFRGDAFSMALCREWRQTHLVWFILILATSADDKKRNDRQTSIISRTKCQNLNASPIVLQLPLNDQ